MRRSVHNHGFQKRLPEDFRALVCCWQAKDHWLCGAVPSSPVKRTKVRSGWQMGRIKLEWIPCRGCSPGDISTLQFSRLSEGETFCTSENTQKKMFQPHFEHDLLRHLLTWPTFDLFWFYLAKPCSLQGWIFLLCWPTLKPHHPPGENQVTEFVKVGKDLQEHEVQTSTNAFPIVSSAPPKL